MEDIKSPIKAIHAFCIECMGGSVREVKDCNSTSCPLHAFRNGKNPYIQREMTPEQKQAAKERLEQARLMKGKE